MFVARYIKGIVASVGGIGVILNEVLAESGQLVGQDWAAVAIAVATALGVIGLPNDPQPPKGRHHSATDLDPDH